MHITRKESDFTPPNINKLIVIKSNRLQLYMQTGCVQFVLSLQADVE